MKYPCQKRNLFALKPVRITPQQRLRGIENLIKYVSESLKIF